MSVNVKSSVGRPTRIEDFLLQWGVDIVSWFEEWQVMNNRIATGDSVSGYYVDLTEKNHVRIGNEVDYMPYPLTGRNAGKFPPKEAIEQWIVDKGIVPDDISIESLAFLIGRKIAKEGTDQPRLKKQNIEMVINSKSDKWLNRIADAVGKEVNDVMVESLTKNGTFKEK